MDFRLISAQVVSKCVHNPEDGKLDHVRDGSLSGSRFATQARCAQIVHIFGVNWPEIDRKSTAFSYCKRFLQRADRPKAHRAGSSAPSTTVVRAETSL